MQNSSRSALHRYGMAIAAVILATLARMALDPALGDLFPFATMFLAVLVVAGSAGRGPALLATGLGAVASARFLLPPRDSFEVRGFENQAGLVLYLVVGVGTALLGGALRDARRRAEASVAEARGRAEQLRVTLSSVGDAVIATDLQGRVAFLNPAAGILTGWTQEEAERQPLESVFRIINEHTRLPTENPVARALRDGAVVGLANHTLLIAKDGTERAIDDSAAPIRDDKGVIAGAVLVFRDVGERRRAEKALVESEALKAAVLQTALDAIITIDHEGRVVEFNPAAETTFGYARSEAVGRELCVLIVPPSLRDAHRRGMAHYLATGEGPVLGKRIEITSVRADGSEFPVELAITRISTGGPPLFTAHVRDITGRKRIEESLREGEERFRGLMEQAPFSVQIFAPDGTTARVNRAWERLWGVTLDQIADYNILEDPQLEAKGVMEPIRRAFAGEAASVPAIQYDPNETIPDLTIDADRRRWVSAVAYPLKDAAGRVREVVLVHDDITESKRAEEALRAGEERLRLALAAGRMGTWDWDIRTGALAWSDNLEEVHGLPPGGFDGTVEGFRRLVHPEDRERLEAAITRSIEEVSGYEAEFRFVRPDGSLGWMLGSGKVFADEAGLPARMIGLALDITGRKRDEAALREVQGRLAAIVDHSPAIIFLKDRDGRYLLVNRRFEELAVASGIKGPYVGRTDADLLPPDMAEQLRLDDLEVMESGRVKVYEESLKLGGEGHAGLTTKFPLRDDAGEVYAVCGINLDISDRLRIEEEMRVAKEEAEAANQAKTQFLAVLSHELRTPLNPILLAASSMLERDADPEEIRPTLQMIRQNVNLQARLIDDLLDVMRIVRGKMPLHWEVADAHQIVEQAIQICRSEFSGHEMLMKVDLAAARRHVNADAARLQQVFWNLIKNAVKFTPGGGTITIRTRNEPTPDERDDFIAIEVTDTGIGIEPEILPRIFDPFQQGETTITRKFGGLGLGLAICKGIVDAHGGAITVESGGKDQGTTFRVVLKTLQEQAVEGDGQPVGGEPAVGRVEPSSLRILVVEDEPATLRLMAKLLGGLGHVVTTAGTIASGYEAFEARAFDLIVSDIGLPDGTGLELMRKVVALRGSIPAIALTGYGMEDDIQKSRAAGFTTHMTKPIDFTKLAAMIRQVVSGGARGGPASPRDAEPGDELRSGSEAGGVDGVPLPEP